jgi:hypothetical protein
LIAKNKFKHFIGKAGGKKLWQELWQPQLLLVISLIGKEGNQITSLTPDYFPVMTNH